MRFFKAPRLKLPINDRSLLQLKTFLMSQIFLLMVQSIFLAVRGYFLRNEICSDKY